MIALQILKTNPQIWTDLLAWAQAEGQGKAEAEAELAGLSPRELVDAWLEWNGIIGYTGWIIELVHLADAVAHTRAGSVMSTGQKKRILRCGFRGPSQVPLFMVWEEFWERGEVVFARVIFNSRRWIGV